MKLPSIIAALCIFALHGFGQTTLEEFQNALKSNPKSSAAHYGIGVIYFQQRAYQPSALEFSNALKGDLQPKWTEVWSRINLGKIFDATDQRDRAVAEYNLAIATKDDTNGALEEAAKYLQSPFKP